MDIALNITTAPQPLRSKPIVEGKLASAGKRVAKKNNGAAGGFTFQFQGGGNVKALVARKRPVKSNEKSSSETTTTKKQPQPHGTKQTEQGKETQTKQEQEKEKPSQSPALKSVAFRRKSTNVVTAPRKNFVQAPAKNEEDILLSYAKVPVAEPDNLMLNVCSTPAAVKPKKLTRIERKQQKRDTGKNETRTSVLEKLRKQRQNPNQQPRIGDLPDKDQLKDEEEEKDDGDLRSKMDPKARKANAFRVKRPEDSSVKKIDLFKNNPEAKLMGQRAVKPITERIFDGTKVETLGLHEHAVKNLKDLLSITELTTVQQKAIPKALEGKDILVRSQTGSGKTLAYALPIVERLQAVRPKVKRDDGILAVVIVPTRELAIQTYELFVKLVKPYTWLVPGVLMGGEKRKSEKARLRKGMNILVGTPGRVVDHLLHTETFKLGKVRTLVLDEADRVLEMGYERDVKQIVEAIDKHREEAAMLGPVEPMQRLLLSATLTSAVQKLAGLTLQQPIYIDNSDEDPSKALPSTNGYTKEAIEASVQEDSIPDGEDATGILTIPEHLQLNFVVVPPKLRLVTFSAMLAKEFKAKQQLKAIVFMSTMEMVNFHHDLLNEQLTRKILDEEDEEDDENSDDDDEGDPPLLKGLRFFKLHGSMTQTERQGVFKGFRDCKSGVLLATDVVGRGIDVPAIDLVVQYSPPQKTADFVHRVGRTARAGRSGRAVLFLAPSEAQFVRCLEEKRIRIAQLDMDVYLKALCDADSEANNIQEAASNLQHKFQETIADDKELHEKACKAFVSWMKFYSTFPKELKSVFNIKNAHMGHFAKSFGLKDQPTSFTKKHSAPKPAPPTNRLTYTERDPEKIAQDKKAKKRRFATTVTGHVRNTTQGSKDEKPRFHGNKLIKFMPKSRALMTSEFDSGLPAMKKRKMG